MLEAVEAELAFAGTPDELRFQFHDVGLARLQHAQAGRAGGEVVDGDPASADGQAAAEVAHRFRVLPLRAGPADLDHQAACHLWLLREGMKRRCPPMVQPRAVRGDVQAHAGVGASTQGVENLVRRHSVEFARQLEPFQAGQDAAERNRHVAAAGGWKKMHAAFAIERVGRRIGVDDRLPAHLHAAGPRGLEHGHRRLHVRTVAGAPVLGRDVLEVGGGLRCPQHQVGLGSVQGARIGDVDPADVEPRQRGHGLEADRLAGDGTQQLLEVCVHRRRIGGGERQRAALGPDQEAVVAQRQHPVAGPCADEGDQPARPPRGWSQRRIRRRRPRPGAEGCR
jgi:hypothetical protein